MAGTGTIVPDTGTPANNTVTVSGTVQPGSDTATGILTVGSTKAGGPSKASYTLGDGVADRVKAAGAELLDAHPLYPGLDLA